MLWSTYLYENRLFTNKVNAASFERERKKDLALIKSVKLIQEFEEAHKVYWKLVLVDLKASTNTIFLKNLWLGKKSNHILMNDVQM